MSETNIYENRLSSRKSIRYFVENRHTSRDLHSSMYSHMLIEDLHLGIMPIGGHSENPNFKVEVAPESPELENIIRLGLPTHDGEPYNITEAVCDFIEEATHIIACYGKAYYEVVYFYADETKQKIDSFQLINIPNSNIKNICGLYWQYVPQRALKYREYEKRFIWLPRKDIFIISFPKALGGATRLVKLLSELKWVSECTIPKFAMDDMAMQKQQPGYEFSLYVRNQEIFLSKLTKHLGWPARGLLSDQMLEFYQLYKYLKFGKIKAILREMILKKLNHLIDKIGKKLGFEAQIRVQGIPLSSDFDRYIKELVNGDLQFSDILKITKL